MNNMIPSTPPPKKPDGADGWLAEHATMSYFDYPEIRHHFNYLSFGVFSGFIALTYILVWLKSGGYEPVGKFLELALSLHPNFEIRNTELTAFCSSPCADRYAASIISFFIITIIGCLYIIPIYAKIYFRSRIKKYNINMFIVVFIFFLFFYFLFHTFFLGHVELVSEKYLGTKYIFYSHYFVFLASGASYFGILFMGQLVMLLVILSDHIKENVNDRSN